MSRSRRQSETLASAMREAGIHRAGIEAYERLVGRSANSLERRAYAMACDSNTLKTRLSRSHANRYDALANGGQTRGKRAEGTGGIYRGHRLKSGAWRGSKRPGERDLEFISDLDGSAEASPRAGERTNRNGAISDRLASFTGHEGLSDVRSARITREAASGPANPRLKPEEWDRKR